MLLTINKGDSMEIITEDTMRQLIEGAKNVATIATSTTKGTVATASNVSNTLMTEAINLFIVDSILQVLKFSAVFIVFLIIKKYIDTMMEMYKDKVGMFKAFKTCALIASIAFFTSQSFPHITSIAKCLVAPKIFLMEKAADLIKH
jgi:hypothetical protein